MAWQMGTIATFEEKKAKENQETDGYILKREGKDV